MNNSKEKHLNLYPIDYPFETLKSRIESGKLILEPDFQRKYKWDKKGWGRASKFIESCLMRIPLPSCYFAEDVKGNHIVIDGVQRLTTIQKFFNDEFALEGMTAFSELEGKKFSELNESNRSDLENTTIRCIVLRKDNPEKLIREIFARLNQGSFNNLLDELAILLSGYKFNSIKDDSGKSELVLRYFALSSDTKLANYSDNLKEYLDSYLHEKVSASETEINTYRDKFKSALENCKIAFGDEIFLNLTRKRNMTLKAIVHYDLQMYSVGQLDTETVRRCANNIKSKYKELCDREDFGKTLKRSVQTKSSITTRRKLWDTLLQEALTEN